LTQALRLGFENSTRAIDPSKNQPNRLRFDRAREFSSLVRTTQTSGWFPHRFWPFTLLVTYPLIFCVSGAVAFAVLPDHAVATRVAWAGGVLALVVALSCTACRDPGVLRRHPEKPGAAWRWNDQARTYRPPESVYDEDLGVVVTGFDHVCPWTGTGIGEKNLCAFHCFVSLLCVCIIFDVLLVMKVLP